MNFTDIDPIDEVFLDASKTRTEIFKEKYSKKINLKTLRNNNGETLLHVSAGYGRFTLTKYLIENGLDVNCIDNAGQAPLHNCANHKHSKVVALLLEFGADVNLQDNKGWTPLLFAIRRKVNTPRITPDYWKVIRILLEAGADPYLLTLSGKPYLSRLDDQDKRDIRLIHLINAIQTSPIDMRIQLVDKFLQGIDMVSWFFDLIKEGDTNLDTIRQFITTRTLDYRLETNNLITPLHRAAGYNQVETARLFIDHGARIDVEDKYGRIPLFNAAQFAHVEMIEFLVQKGSNVNKRDSDGLTPLHVAAASNPTFRACLRFIQLGADVNARCNLGKLPYDLAVTDDTREVLKPVTYEASLKAPKQTLKSLPEPSKIDCLMFDSSLDAHLLPNLNISTIKISLPKSHWRYKEVERRMNKSIVSHISTGGLQYTKYEITKIELNINEKLWSKYCLMCKVLQLDCEKESINEKLLFHGSKCIQEIISEGFDERYAQSDGMFGAGIYFAAHSSKSNQYVFGFDQGCQQHDNKLCNLCDRKMILAQVALGKSLVPKQPLPNRSHPPTGHHSVTGEPGTTEDLTYPEYTIYQGGQAYPLYVIKYKIKF